MKRYCETCATRTLFTKTKEPNVIVCTRCGIKKILEDEECFCRTGRFPEKKVQNKNRNI